ncbi:MAG: PD-(D/E)XK nuclease family transposase [Lachnospira eligens]
MLHLNPEDIKDIEITNPIILGESINAKTFILDVNILLNNSRMLNLEMQVNNLHNWENSHYVIYVQTSASLIKVTHTKILNLYQYWYS